MEHNYTLFIDEAGDDKVENLKPDFENGNSEWLCLGGYLVRANNEHKLAGRRDKLLLSIGGQAGNPLHFRNYNSKNRVKISMGIARFPSRAFIVCSYKQTMIGHKNVRAEAKGNASSNSQYLYNFVVRLLLERVTEFVENDAKLKHIYNPKIRIVMASRKGHHFGHFKAYVLQLINQAIGKSTFLKTKVIQPKLLSYDLIDRAPASKLAGLQLADIVVSSVFQSLEQSSPHFNDQSARHLRRIVAGKERWIGGKKFRNNVGMTLFPAPKSADLITQTQKDFFSSFDYDFEWLKSIQSK